MLYSKRINYRCAVIASDRRERGNLAVNTRLLRRFSPRNDTIFCAFVSAGTLDAVPIVEDGIDLEIKSSWEGAVSFTALRNLHKIVDSIILFSIILKEIFWLQKSLMENSSNKSNFFAPVRYGMLNQFVGSFHADLAYSFLSDRAPDRAEEQTRKDLIMAKETC